MTQRSIGVTLKIHVSAVVCTLFLPFQVAAIGGIPAGHVASHGLERDIVYADGTGEGAGYFTFIEGIPGQAVLDQIDPQRIKAPPRLLVRPKRVGRLLLHLLSIVFVLRPSSGLRSPGRRGTAPSSARYEVLASAEGCSMLAQVTAGRCPEQLSSPRRETRTAGFDSAPRSHWAN